MDDLITFPAHALLILEERLREREEQDGLEPPARPRSGKWLRGQLWNCTDIMPGWLCDDLAMPRGFTYAQGVRSLAH